MQGFDEFMNLVLDEAEEIFVKANSRKKIGMMQLRKLSYFTLFVKGRILLRGDNVSLIMQADRGERR